MTIMLQEKLNEVFVVLKEYDDERNFELKSVIIL